MADDRSTQGELFGQDEAPRCRKCKGPMDRVGHRCQKCCVKRNTYWREHTAKKRAEAKEQGVPYDNSVYQKNRYHEKKDKGICIHCPKVARPDRRTCESCGEMVKRLHRERYKRYKGTRKCHNCGSPKEPGRGWCAGCRKRDRDRDYALKVETMNAYGGCRCCCCGITIVEFLTLDHPNRDGAKHRRALGAHGGNAVYRKLKELGFPQDPVMRVQCHNCNTGRGASLICPCRQQQEMNGDGEGI